MRTAKGRQAYGGRRLEILLAGLAFVGLHSSALSGESFLQRHCMECHDNSTREGGLSIEDIKEPIDAAGHTKLLEKIVGKIERREMPPDSEDVFFDSKETTAFLTSARSELLAYFNEKKKTGLGGIQRLRSDQYVNTLHDLFGYPFRDLESIIPTDTSDSRQPGEISYFHFDRYVESADAVLNYAIGRRAGQAKSYLFNLENAYKVIYWLKADHIRAPVSKEKES